MDQNQNNVQKVMIYARIVGGVFAILYVLYIFLCCLEMWGIIKFTKEKVTISFPKVMIPFYYFFK